MNIEKVDFKRSDKDFVATILLCFFVGALGVHRFYVGKIGTGILLLFTFWWTRNLDNYRFNNDSSWLV